MKEHRSQGKTTDVERPECSCGRPATHEMDLTVRRLELQRDAGVHSQSYWTASYKATVTHVSALICSECLKRDVKITLAMSASVEKAKEKFP